MHAHTQVAVNYLTLINFSCHISSYIRSFGSPLTRKNTSSSVVWEMEQLKTLFFFASITLKKLEISERLQKRKKNNYND